MTISVSQVPSSRSANPVKQLLCTAALSLAILSPFAVSPAPAEAAASPEITQMTDDLTALGDLAKDVMLPVAGIVIAFVIGSRLVKRTAGS